MPVVTMYWQAARLNGETTIEACKSPSLVPRAEPSQMACLRASKQEVGETIATKHNLKEA